VDSIEDDWLTHHVQLAEISARDRGGRRIAALGVHILQNNTKNVI
jgi:hypothetical protein